jgi:hypothetical protein
MEAPMPKKDDAPEYAVCDGCGMERADTEALGDLMLCPGCAERRADDPVVTVHGRTLHYSELKAQVEDDKHLAAALDGDTVQSQVKAARR